MAMNETRDSGGLPSTPNGFFSTPRPTCIIIVFHETPAVNSNHSCFNPRLMRTSPTRFLKKIVTKTHKDANELMTN